MTDLLNVQLQTFSAALIDQACLSRDSAAHESETYCQGRKNCGWDLILRFHDRAAALAHKGKILASEP